MGKRMLFMVAGTAALLILAGVFLYTGEDNAPVSLIADEEMPLGIPSIGASEYESGYGITWSYDPAVDPTLLVGYQGDQPIGKITVLGSGGSDGDLTRGMTRSDAERILGSPISSINGTRSAYAGTAGKSFYRDGDDTLILYYDIVDQDRIVFVARISNELAKSSRFLTSSDIGAYSVENTENMAADLLNAVRSGYGKTSLVKSPQLATLSRHHSQSMVDGNYFSHDNPAGLGPKERIKAAGIKYRSYGEALSAGTWTPMDAIINWMNSPPHRSIILGDYTAVGVGIADGDSAYGIYYTLNVIRN